MTARLYISLLYILLALNAVGATLNFGGRQAATVGICVVDLRQGGAVTASENPDVAMIPASILKSLTSATALNMLGADHRFLTEAVIDGQIDGATLRGDLIIRSSGDPSLDSKHFGDITPMTDEIVAALRSRGIKEITGDIIVDEEFFVDSGPNPQWVVEDLDYDYGTGCYGLNWRDNLTGNIPADYPADEFADTLRSRLRADGIKVRREESTADGPTERLCIHTSPALSDILRSLMHRSDNMMAEAVLRSIAPEATRSEAIKKELAHWNANGITTDYVKIADGSGLARMDRVNARFMANMLAWMARSSNADTYTAIFPKVGREGTVKNLLRNTRLDGKLALKSGSMNGVHCYAGYKLDADGRPTHAVVVMVNNFFCTRDSLRRAIEQWLLQTFPD